MIIYECAKKFVEEYAKHNMLHELADECIEEDIEDNITFDYKKICCDDCIYVGPLV